MAREIRFEVVLSKAEHVALTEMAHRETLRLEQHFTRADWVRREIQRKAQRLGLLRKSE